jgi:hypothetical protein
LSQRTLEPKLIISPYSERGQADSAAEGADGRPAASGIERGAGCGSGSATNEVGHHVVSVDAAAGLGRQRVDHVLVEDVHRLDSHVNDDDTGDQGDQRLLAEVEQREGGRDSGGTGGGSQWRMTSVGHPPGQRCTPSTSGAK